MVAPYPNLYSKIKRRLNCLPEKTTFRGASSPGVKKGEFNPIFIILIMVLLPTLIRNNLLSYYLRSYGTITIIILTSLISKMGITGQLKIDKYYFLPNQVAKGKEIYSLVTAGFFHGDYGHLAVNMLGLLFFGSGSENLLTSKYGFSGHIYFTLSYLLLIAFANLISLPWLYKNKSYQAIGASGGVVGLLTSYIILNPSDTISLYFIIPIRANLFLLGYLAYTLIQIYRPQVFKKLTKPNVAHTIHLGGIFAGVIYTWLIAIQLGIPFLHTLEKFI